jgi:dihydroorotase
MPKNFCRLKFRQAEGLSHQFPKRLILGGGTGGFACRSGCLHRQPQAASSRVSRSFMKTIVLIICFAYLAWSQEYDLLLKGGQVIDPKNNINARRDIAITGGKIAAVAPDIPAAKAYKVVDVSPFYVTPGLVDIHAHFWGDPGAGLHPDSLTFRSGVTTVVDAGGSGWRDFPQFKKDVMDTAVVRVLAWINILGRGMTTEKAQQDTTDMDPRATADMIRAHRDVIVGVKTAHYAGPEWIAVDRALEAAKLAGTPVMVDFGFFHPKRPFQQLVLEKLRPGDIYTHTYLNPVPMIDEQGRVMPYLFEARKRGVLFDVGHGQGSFLFRKAVPAIKQGFMADSISTDLHKGSMNAGMKDMLTVMSKFLNIGVRLEDLIRRSTWNPAKEIHREDLGHLSVGAPADIAVLRIEKGKFGFVDVYKARMDGTQRLDCELTVRNGKVVWELNGITRQRWDKLGNYPSQGDHRWDGTAEDDPKPKRKP